MKSRPKQVFILSKENLSLSVQEVLSLLKPSAFQRCGNILLLEADSDFNQRLAYTRAVYNPLFHVKDSALRIVVSRFCWDKVYKKDFCVRAFNAPFSEQLLASWVGKHITSPRSNLASAKTNIHFFGTKKGVICGLLLYKNSENFNARKAHRRPALHPTSLHPQLARCLINLTGIQKGRIIDPFCGSGGILIEAGLMGLKPVGFDNDADMLARADKNLRYFGIKNCVLQQRDSSRLDMPMDFVVADLPYCLNSKKQDIEMLYSSFIAVLSRHLRKRAVVVFPGFFNYKKLLRDSHLKVEHVFTMYIHKSLSKRILVLAPA